MVGVISTPSQSHRFGCYEIGNRLSSGPLLPDEVEPPRRRTFKQQFARLAAEVIHRACTNSMHTGSCGL